MSPQKSYKSALKQISPTNTLSQIKKQFETNWQEYPPRPYDNQAWRVINLAATKKSWRVAEVEFYLDEDCHTNIIDNTRILQSLQERGVELISSGTQGYAGGHPVIHAFDSKPETYWQAQCRRGYDLRGED